MWGCPLGVRYVSRLMQVRSSATPVGDEVVFFQLAEKASLKLMVISTWTISS
jgi:hypothetical protein